MPKLPVVNGHEAAAALERGGFELQRTVGSHAIYHHPVTGARTTVPMWKKDLRKGTLRDIIRQAGLTVAEFEALLR